MSTTTTTTKTVLAWHFLSDNGKLRTGDDPPHNGRWLRHDGDLRMCESGLHASIRAIDALHYAPGNIVCRVECGGVIEHEDDKLVCSQRKIIWRADAKDALRAFARWCALQVIHLCDAPAVVREYLETGDESKRYVARAAARDAAWAAAGAAAWDTVWAAAGDTVWAAVWYASMVARDAAGAAARAAAWDTVWAAAGDTVWAAAGAAARAAAWYASMVARDAAGAAADAAQNAKFTEMLESLEAQQRGGAR